MARKPNNQSGNTASPVDGSTDDDFHADGAEFVTVDSGTIGSGTSGSDSIASGSGNSGSEARTKRAYTKRGTGGKESGTTKAAANKAVTPDQLAGFIKAAHVFLAARNPAFEIEDEEALEIAVKMSNVMRHHKSVVSEKTMDYFALFACLVAIEGPKLMMARIGSNKPKEQRDNVVPMQAPLAPVNWGL